MKRDKIIQIRKYSESKSPTHGTIGFLGQVLENQQVEAGTAMISVIPEESEFEVILDLPVQGLGTITEGPEVKIKVDNFPAQEFGSTKRVISRLPPLPKNDLYRIKVVLPDNLSKNNLTDMHH